jgi:hypothetical protein
MYSERSPVTDIMPKHFPEGWGTIRAAESRQEGSGPAAELFHMETLRVKLIREDDGRITVASTELDIAAFGSTELEAWENFLSALEELRDFYFENRETLSPQLLRKLHIFESIYLLQME